MSLGTFLTRQVPGIAAGIVPYIGVNNVLYRHTGRQMSYNSIQLGKGIKQIDKYWPAFWKERPYEVFWMFSLGRDLYFDAYDKLTGKTKEEKKEGIPSAERKDNPDRAEGAPVASTAVAVPTPQIGHVFHQGELAAAPAVEPSRATA
jgi:hypothetical protein